MESVSESGRTNKNPSLEFMNLGQYGRTLRSSLVSYVRYSSVETASIIVSSRGSQQKERSRVKWVILIPEPSLQLCEIGFVSQ